MKDVNPLAVNAACVFGPNLPSVTKPKQPCTFLIASALQPRLYEPEQGLYPPVEPPSLLSGSFSCSLGVNKTSVSSIIPSNGLVNIFHSSGLSVKSSKNCTSPPGIFLSTAHKSAIVGISVIAATIASSSSLN